MTVIDIDVSLGDGAQLGHASSLHPGQAVPDGERWHGSPAQRTEVDYRAVEPADCGARRRIAYSVLQLLSVLVLSVPLAAGGVVMLFAEVPQLAALLDAGPSTVTTWTFYRDALAASLVLFFGSLLFGFLCVGIVPRVLNLAVDTGQGLSLVRLPLRGPSGDRADDQSQVLHDSSSVTAPPSSVTCAGSGTTFRRSCRPGRTSAPR